METSFAQGNSSSAGKSGATLALFALVPTTVMLGLALVVTARFSDRKQTQLEARRQAAELTARLARNRVYLDEYLLSGDTRNVDLLKSNEEGLHQSLQHAIARSQSQQERDLLQRLASLNRDWEEEFAKPMIERRQQVDRGDTTVAVLQISYLQADPVGWSFRFDNILANLQRQSVDLYY